LHRLLDWLDAHGCKRDGIDLRPDAHGGIGAFATRNFSTGGLLATVPRECVITAAAAVESPVCIAARTAAASLEAEQYCTPDSLLWVYMCVGRVDGDHPWHPYLSSLPEESPEPTCWPAAQRAMLDGTPVKRAPLLWLLFVLPLSCSVRTR
jgi:hypothetical protein